ncbi:hypothetical protein [Buttiauxella gaviniae]|uniref:hypothetical protein n=1 Tax=Buttiauxella gaviniae TaxID=82990 RepID=UPI003C73D252
MSNCLPKITDVAGGAENESLSILLCSIRRNLGYAGQEARSCLLATQALNDADAAAVLKTFINQALGSSELCLKERDIYEGCLVKYRLHEQRMELYALASFMLSDY